MGAYIPQCDSSGTYTPEQCQSSTGNCWCVSEYGQEIPGTRISPGGTRRTNCASERARAGESFQPASTFLSGQCPSPVGIGVCINNCKTDAECQNLGRKCCSNGCGKECMTPIRTGTLTTDEKSGTCPRSQSNPLGPVTGDECLIDVQCVGNQKCCQTSVGKKCLLPDNGEFGQG